MRQESRPAYQAALVVGAMAAMFTTLSADAQSNARLNVVTVAPKGEVRFVAPVGQAAASNTFNKNTPANLVARSVLQQYADQFGIVDSVGELQEVQTTDDSRRGPVVRYRQLRQGLPVIAGDVIVALTTDRAFESMTGKVSSRTVPTVTPRVTAVQAQRIAGITTAKYESVPLASLVASEPELSIYDPQLLGPPSTLPPALVWRVEVQAYSPLEPIRYFVLVDAQYGSIALNFNQVETARNRMTYTGNTTATVPGTLLCNESQPLCTGGTNADADYAHRYAGEMYDFYFSRFGRDSYNGSGAAIISTVQSTVTSPCPNAAWIGFQMVYCAGAPQADDVVGHELTHAVTSNTSRLFYYYQSGAINESISDVFGEFLDLTNTTGTDTPAVRWKIGEDFAGLGVLRDMRNPQLFSDPDRMTSPFYWTAPTDTGGVHINSGINNKAAYLMTDGDTFNGFRIVGMGLEKVARLYYETQTRYLTSGSNYADLYLALNQACHGLIGTFNFTANDCLQVANTVDAVEMNLEPPAGLNPEASICPVNQAPIDIHFANFDLTNSGWSATTLLGANTNWTLTNLYAAKGARSYAITGLLDAPSDNYIAMNAAVTVPANAYLHFRHSFVFENVNGVFYDGGVLEYTVNNGTTWLDAGSLIEAGKNYGGTLDVSDALGARPAFVGFSNGYVSTRLNLSSFVGQSIRFRFRNGTDNLGISSFRGVGWTVDEVRLYTCATDPSPNLPPVANAGVDQTTAPLMGVTVDGSQSIDNDGSIASAIWSQVSGPQAVLTPQGRRAASFLAPIVATQGTVVLRLSVTDNRGVVSTDDVSILVVNQQPSAAAGADQSGRKPRNTVNVSGSGTDNDGSVVGYNWTQVSGPTVTITNANQNAASFVAPSVATTDTVVLRLTVADNFGGTGTDDVSIGVVNTQPVANAGADARMSAGSSVPLSGSGTDSDGSVVSYSWAQVDGTAVTINNASTNAPNFTGHSPRYTEALTFRLTVTDNDGGTGTDDVAVQIVGLEGDPPVPVAPPPPPAEKKGGGAFTGSDLLLLMLWALVMAYRRKVERSRVR